MVDDALEAAFWFILSTFFSTLTQYQKFVAQFRYYALLAFELGLSLVPLRSLLDQVFGIPLLVANAFLFSPETWIIGEAAPEIAKLTIYSLEGCLLLLSASLLVALETSLFQMSMIDDSQSLFVYLGIGVVLVLESFFLGLLGRVGWVFSLMWF